MPKELLIVVICNALYQRQQELISPFNALLLLPLKNPEQALFFEAYEYHSTPSHAKYGLEEWDFQHT